MSGLLPLIRLQAKFLCDLLCYFAKSYINGHPEHRKLWPFNPGVFYIYIQSYSCVWFGWDCRGSILAAAVVLHSVCNVWKAWKQMFVNRKDWLKPQHLLHVYFLFTLYTLLSFSSHSSTRSPLYALHSPTHSFFLTLAFSGKAQFHILSFNLVFQDYVTCVYTLNLWPCFQQSCTIEKIQNMFTT